MKKNFISSIFLCFLATNFAFSQSVTLSPTNDLEILVTRFGSINVASFVGRQAQGTATSPLATTSIDNLLIIGAQGYTGAGFTSHRATITFSPSETFTQSANGTRIKFSTTPNGSTFNTQRMVIDHNGNVGIGTTSPEKKLHVAKGVSGVTPHSAANSFFEDNTDNYINIAAPDADATGLLFGKTTNAAHGGIVYTGGGNMQLRTGGNQTRVNIDSQGKVGIGTTNPDTKLHVDGDENDGTTAALKITSGSQNMLFDGNEIDVASNGSIFINNNSNGGVYLAGGGGGVRVGANGTGLSDIIRATVNIPAFSVSANSCSAPSLTITNAALNSTVHVSPEVSLSSGLLIAYARVTSSGNLLMRVCNVTNATVNQSAIDYHFTIIR